MVLLVFVLIPGEPKKIPPTTFVDITAMHGNFCTKFYMIVKRSNIHFITKFYWNISGIDKATVLTTTTPILRSLFPCLFVDFRRRTNSLRSSTVSSPIHRWSSHVNAPTYSLHSVQFPLFFRICLDDGFRTKALLTQRLHPHLVGRWNLSHEGDVKRNTWEKNRLLNVWLLTSIVTSVLTPVAVL